MSLSSVLSLLLVGVISGNVITSSMVAVYLAGNNLNTTKNSLILSLFVFGVTLFSGIAVYLANVFLIAIGYTEFIIFIAFFVVAVFVQVADNLLEKLFPIVHTKLNSFIVALIPAITLILFSVCANSVTFVELLLNILFTNLGVAIVLALISGVRENKLTYSSYGVFKGNLMTLAILFVLAIVWTAV